MTCPHFRHAARPQMPLSRLERFWESQSDCRNAEAMPFQEFTSFFGPDDLDAMIAAYNSVWFQLLVMGMAVSPLVKKKLEQVILAAACAGSRDRKRLEDIALRALSHEPSARR
jgi:hypothetical protein